MNIRWLWLDQFPVGLDLTTQQRRDVIRRARAIRQSTNYGSCRQALLWSMLGTIAPLTALFLGWVFWHPKIPTAAGRVINGIATPLVFNGLIWVAITYSMYRTSAPYVRRALCELGFSVCISCGYILRGLRADETLCPECGTTRQPITSEATQ